jgi:DNA-binding NarL/FixJ family response regulator
LWGSRWEDLGPIQIQATPRRVALATGREGATVRALIVDEHRLFAEAVRVTLEDVGISVVDVVSRGADALEAVDRSHPDIILMDIALPDQSGLTAGRAILERHPDAKIIAVTALSERAAVDEALRAGFLGYLTKDTPVEQFVNAVRSVMGGHLILPLDPPPPRAS